MKKKLFSFDNPEILVPGDKSLSHRFVIFASMAEGESECTGFLEGEDPLATMESFSQLGVHFEKKGNGAYRVESPGLGGFRSPHGVLDFGNAGTGIRLTCGLLAGMEGMRAELTGDASLQKRPMDRIIQPLRKIGAEVSSIPGNGRAPLRVEGKKLQSGSYESPIASAQVKSCLMFAAIASQAELEYKEAELSRNHTENMMQFLGGKIDYLSPTHFRIQPPYKFQGTKFAIPGDISSAAFFIVLGLLGDESSQLTVQNVGLNPSRVGILEVLEKMGGRIRIINKRRECGEDAGDLEVFGSRLKRTEIPASLIPSIIDEIPILTIAGLFAEGGFGISHAEELRAKESDRIHSMVVNLRKLGVNVTENKDGYEFPEWGSSSRKEDPHVPTSSVQIESFMDHRIAMSFAILEKATSIPMEIDDTSWVETSFPGFFQILKRLSAES